MPALDAGGVSLYYEEAGEGETVVLVHGTVSDHTMWKPWVETLSPAFRTITYGRRYAHPNVRQGDVTDSTVENNAGDLDALVDEVGGGKVHLAGHSYGGFIAAYYALKHPQKLRSLTLINAAVVPMLVRSPGVTGSISLLFRAPAAATSGTRVMNAAKATWKAAERGDSSAAMKLFVPAVDGRKDLPHWPAGFDAMATRNARTVREVTLPSPHVGRTEARRIGVPTLVMYGGLSAPWDRMISRRLAESIPGAEEAAIQGASHMCPVEKPTETSQKVLEFQRAHSGPHVNFDSTWNP